MANDGSIKIGVSVDEKDIKTGLKKVEKEADSTAKQVSDSGSSSGKGWKTALNDLGSLSKKGFSALGSAAVTAAKTATAAIAGISTALLGLATAGVNYNAEIETYQTSFEVMTGSAEKAQEVIEELKKVGAETPFELPDLADATQLLMNYGFTADEAMDRMMMLGDISQGSADKMQRIAMAYGQMSSAGKVSLEDVKQMIEAGFNPLQEISESTGESMDSLYDRISKGTLSVDEITASMQRATSEGGKYFQSMEKQSQTFEGQMSTLKDNAQQLLGDIMKPISEEMTKNILPAANEALATLSQAFNEGGFEQMFQAGGVILQNLIQGMAEKLPDIMMMAGTILGSLIQGFVMALPTLVESAFTIIETFLNAMIQNGPAIVEGGVNIILQVLNGIASKLPELIPMAVNAILTFASSIVQNLPQIWQAGREVLVSLVQGLMNSLPDLLRQAPVIIANFVAAFIQDLPNVIATGAQILFSLVTGILQSIPSLLAGIGEVVANIINAITGTDWIEVGKDILRGIGEGIGNMGQWLLDKAIECVQGAFDGICEWLGIASPSKKAKKEIGVNWVKGEGEGFEEETPNLIKTAQKSTQQVFDATKKEVASRFVTSAQSRAYEHPAAAFVDQDIDDNEPDDDDGPVLIQNQFVVDSDVIIDKTTKATIKQVSRTQKGKDRYK